MKKFFLFFTLIVFSDAYSQCAIPQHFTGNTGANMTLMLLPDFINSLSVSSEDAYVVAFSSSNLVVGSTEVFGEGQTTLAIWGDDTDSPEVDGAVSNEEISLKLVDAGQVYDISTTSSIVYSTNGMSVQSDAVSLNLCGSDLLIGDCDYPGIYSGNTGNNMTVMLTSSFVSALTVTNESAYISVSSNGMLVGSTDIYGLSQTSLPIWGDDASTPEVDGAQIGENVVIELVDGSSIYLLSTPEVPFVVNGTQILTSLLSQTLTCGVSVIEGCTQDWAENFNPAANTEDNSCVLSGCMNPNAVNYVPFANVDAYCDLPGCTDAIACNFVSEANNDDNSCFYNEIGYDCDGECSVDTDSDGICDGFEVLGCQDEQSCNYNEFATDAGFCAYPSQEWLNCDEECINDADNDGVCDQFEVEGCLDPTAFNYNQNATNSDGSCIAAVLGCTNSNATNFDSSANTDNGSCLVEGCTDASAFNYDTDANINDGSCQAILEGCTDSAAANFNGLANVDNGSCEAVVAGCTDAAALNYDINANIDNASCQYVSFDGAWPNDPNGLTNTGNNATIAITGDLSLSTGDYLGAFYQSGDELICGGLLIWNEDAENQLIVLWGDDVGSDIQDGFASGENVIWKAKVNSSTSSDDDFNLYPTYSYGDNTYMVNAPYVISSWIENPIYGCMNLAYQEFDENALVDDGSCSSLWSILYTAQAEELLNANTLVDALGTQLLTTQNELASTTLTMQASYDSMVLDYQGQLFTLNTWLTDSLNAVHADYTLEIANLNAAWGAQVAGLENDLVVLNQGLVDSITSFDNQILALNELMSGNVSSLEFQIDSLQLDSLVLANLLDTTIANYDVQLAGLNSNIADLTIELADTIASYEAQIVSLTASHNAEIVVINATHDSVVLGLNNAAADAADTALLLLNQSITDYELDLDNLEFSYEAQISSITSTYDNTIAVLNAEDAAEDGSYEIHIANLQADSTQFSIELTAANENVQSLDSQVSLLSAENTELTENLAYHSAPLNVNLNQGWNMVGFGLQEQMDAVASLEVLGNKLHLIKDNNAAVYWPEFGFNSLGVLIPGQGYQIRMYEEHLEFTFPYLSGERLDVYPQVPVWAIEMEIPTHPNDSRNLIRVVNMLGQEVRPDDAFTGEVLLYLYSDGTVEKKQK